MIIKQNRYKNEILKKMLNKIESFMHKQQYFIVTHFPTPVQFTCKRNLQE